jgi:GNAT superfamily N-acetyltransferase
MNQSVDADGPPSAAPGRTEISRLVPDQWAAYRQARLAALAEAPHAFGSTRDREEGLDERRWRERIDSAATFLAWRDGRPVGTATGLANERGQDYEISGSWQLVGMWVDPAARGSGVADRLVDAVARHARAEGAPALTLWVTDVNDRARAFYQRLGFRMTGVRGLVRPTEPDDWEELMVRDLDGITGG